MNTPHQLLLRGLPIRLLGPDAQQLKDGFCYALGVQAINRVRVDVIVTDRLFIVAPGTKDRSELAALGVLFGGGALGGAAVGLISGLAEAWHKKSPRKTLVKDNLPAEVMAYCAVWQRDGLQIEVYEERTHWDLYGGEWETSPRISGTCRYNDRVLEAKAEFAFAGRVNNLPLRSKPKEVLPLLDILGFKESQIKRRSVWRTSDD